MNDRRRSTLTLAALVIGEAVEAQGFFWLAGQGGYGFQTAPAAARRCAGEPDSA